jgi:hypothetical protein
LPPADHVLAVRIQRRPDFVAVGVPVGTSRSGDGRHLGGAALVAMMIGSIKEPR